MEFAHDHGSHGVFRPLKQPLNDSTAICVSREMVDLANESVDNKLNMLGRNALDCSLDDMVAILVFDTFEHVVFQLLDHASLLVDQNVLQRLY